MKAYKLLRLRKNGTLSSLFIDKTKILPLNKWLKAEAHPTKGYAFRPGYHCLRKPEAPHLTMEGRVWCEVEIEDFLTIKRPPSQGDIWFLCEWMKITKIITEPSTRLQNYYQCAQCGNCVNVSVLRGKCEICNSRKWIPCTTHTKTK